MMEWTQGVIPGDGITLPDSAEIIANLWYVIDDQGYIYSLRIHLYLGEGTDDEKMAFLKSRAYRDYLVARPFAIPRRFNTIFVEPGGVETKYAVVHHDAVVLMDGIEQLFFEGLDQLQQDLPAQTRLKIPESPLVKVTALTVDKAENIVPIDLLKLQGG